MWRAWVLVGLAGAATLGWGGLWLAGARTIEAGIAGALADPASPASVQGWELGGFPGRFDLTLTEPRLHLPGLGWAAPALQVFALAYQPHHLIAVFPPEQHLSLPGGALRIGTTDGRLSAVFAPARGLELDEVALVFNGLTLTGDAGGLGAEALRLGLRPLAPGRYGAALELVAPGLDDALRARLDPQGLWPGRLAALRLEGELTFDRPLDAQALMSGPLPPAGLTLTAAHARWPGVALGAEGRIDPAAPGGPAGNLTVAVEGWPALLDLLDRAGLIAPEQRAWIAATAPALARPDAPEAVDIPLRLEAGQVRMGPMVLFDFAG